MAIIDMDNGIEVLTDPDEDLKREEATRIIADQQRDILESIIQRFCYEVNPSYPVYNVEIPNRPIFGCGCCGYDPRK